MHTEQLVNIVDVDGLGAAAAGDEQSGLGVPAHVEVVAEGHAVLDNAAVRERDIAAEGATANKSESRHGGGREYAHITRTDELKTKNCAKRHTGNA